MNGPSLAPSLTAVQPSRIRELANVAFGMEGVLRLQFGESNLPTPDYIVAAVEQAITDGYTFYTKTPGCPACAPLSPPNTSSCTR